MTAGTDLDVPVERDEALHLLRQLLRIRRFEERCVELYSATKIRGFLHLRLLHTPEES